MTTPESSIESPARSARESDAELDARWARQERVRKAVGTGADAPALDRALYTALANEALPALPADFAGTTASMAERLADARRRIARFRGFSLRLFGLLYLPAIAVAVWSFASDLPALWLRQTADQRAPLLWAAAVAALWSVIVVVERLRSRRASDVER